MFVVAARAQQPGAARPTVAGRPRWLDSTREPVGLQHAAHRLDDGGPRRARCGADLAGWIILTDRPFDPGSTASCPGCVQLLSAAGPSPG
jgi:hypothetical protein